MVFYLISCYACRQFTFFSVEVGGKISKTILNLNYVQILDINTDMNTANIQLIISEMTKPSFNF